MRLTLGFSPCPNDTFIFDALVNKRIDNERLEFEAVLEDVETLNQWSFEGKLDITKLSYPAFFQNLDKYVLLNSGAALGKGVGPILVSKSDPDSYRDGNRNPIAIGSEIEKSLIALPGQNTTAHMLFSFAYPNAMNKTFMRFDRIENFVLDNTSNDSTLGVIIHENRFTYQQKGLHKVIDLGDYWEQKMNVPIPLGGIAVKRSIDPLIGVKMDRLIRKSIEYARSNYPAITEYVKQHSQELSEDVMRQHIDLYVNNFSIDLGVEGKKAITTLFEVARKMNGLAGKSSSDLFIS